MKNTLLIIILIATFGYAGACNLSQTSLIAVTPGPGTDTTISIQVCFGYGVTGTTNGADGDTRTISFGWYDSNPGFNITSFLPAFITGDSTSCSMPGVDAGPLSAPPYGTQGTILYVDPGYYGDSLCSASPFTCITSTATCGGVGQQCINFSFVVNQVPDSMRVFGVEGGGNAIAGCYPDSDMLLDFGVLSILPDADPFYEDQEEELPARVVSVSSGQIKVYSPAFGRFPIEIMTLDGRAITIKTDLQIGENTIYTDIPSGILITKFGNKYQKHLVL